MITFMKQKFMTSHFFEISKEVFQTGLNRKIAEDEEIVRTNSITQTLNLKTSKGLKLIDNKSDFTLLVDFALKISLKVVIKKIELTFF